MEQSDNQSIVQELRQQIEVLKKENIRITGQAVIDAQKQWQYSRNFQQSQQRFRSVFESSTIGKKIIDRDLTIHQVNMAMVKLLGFNDKKKVIGTKILDYTPPEYIKDWQFLQQQLWGGNSKTFSLESVLVKSNGELIHCRITSILFADQDETLGYTTIEDITEQYKLRKQKEEFISVASHELKTPVTTLKASIQLINKLMVTGTPVTEILRNLAEKGLISVTRLAHLVDELLSTTRLEQGQLPLNTGWFEIGSVLDTCRDHGLLKGKYYLTFNGDRQLKVYGDQYKIDQVLVNLVNNAIKYAPDSEEIILSAQQLDNGVKISITDKGAGIPAEVQPNLFERYYRVNSHANAGNGLGLGLYICAEIIRRHGGEIGVDSSEGLGSSFWFILPPETVEKK